MGGWFTLTIECSRQHTFTIPIDVKIPKNKLHEILSNLGELCVYSF
jgi:hypothetical protein